MEEKKLSANQRWKKSGTTLPFKDWLKREDEKITSGVSDVNFIPFVSADKNAQVVFNATGETDLKEDKSKVFGINKNILIISGLLIVGSLSFYLYKKIKAKK